MAASELKWRGLMAARFSIRESPPAKNLMCRCFLTPLGDEFGSTAMACMLMDIDGSWISLFHSSSPPQANSIHTAELRKCRHTNTPSTRKEDVSARFAFVRSNSLTLYLTVEIIVVVANTKGSRDPYFVMLHESSILC